MGSLLFDIPIIKGVVMSSEQEPNTERTPLDVLSLDNPHLTNVVQWSAYSALAALRRAGFEVVFERGSNPVPGAKRNESGMCLALFF